MGRFTVVFLRRAVGQVELARQWWSEHRPEAPALIDLELTAAVDRIAEFPECGVAVRHPRGHVRRLVLPDSRYLLYYRVRPRAQRCEVIAVIHASRAG